MFLRSLSTNSLCCGPTDATANTLRMVDIKENEMKKQYKT